MSTSDTLPQSLNQHGQEVQRFGTVRQVPLGLSYEARHDDAARAATLGDDGSNDLLVSDIVRTGELQTWFIGEHLVDTPLVDGSKPAATG